MKTLLQYLKFSLNPEGFGSSQALFAMMIFKRTIVKNKDPVVDYRDDRYLEKESTVTGATQLSLVNIMQLSFLSCAGLKSC